MEFGDILEAIDGIAYAVDPNHRILAAAEKNWDRFAAANSAPELTAASVVGREIFDFIQGADVQEFYRQRFQESRAHRAPAIFVTRCDSPAIRRELRLTISAIFSGENFRGWLFQSQVIDEHMRPPIDLFDFKALAQRVGAGTLPLVTICSFCQRIAKEEADRTTWLEAEDYYRVGGTSRVMVSHGMCEDCSLKHFPNYQC